VGFGASGRNAGFAMPLVGWSLDHSVTRFGADRARRVQEAAARSVHEIGAFTRRHAIDCDYERNGLLYVAASRGEIERVHEDLELGARAGLTTGEYLDREAVRARLDSPLFECGWLEEDCAILQPARLARGIKRTAVEAGVRVFEGSRVSSLSDETPIRVTTDRGVDVLADSVVLSVNPWITEFAGFRRKALPMYTYIVLTEPLTDEQLERIGWAGREGVETRLNYLNYFRLTAENRLLWGGEGIYFGRSRIDPRHDRDETALATIEAELRAMFPQLADVRIEHRWGGTMAVTANFSPSFGRRRGSRVFYGFGYCGHGVAASHLGGQILRDLVLNRDSDLADLPIVSPARSFPPEPLASIGERSIRRRWKAQDRAMREGMDVPGDPWALKIAGRL